MLPFHLENENLAGRLRQLYAHIIKLQTDIAAAGDKLLGLREQLDDAYETLLAQGKIRPVHVLLDAITRCCSETEKAQLRQITDPYVVISHTFVVFFSCVVEAFTLTVGGNGFKVPDIVFLVNSAREVEAAVLAAHAQISDVDEEIEAQLRVAELEKSIEQRIEFQDRERPPEDEEWLAHTLIMWCRWVKSVHYSTSHFLESFENLDAESQREKLIGAIHEAQLVRLALLHAQTRSKYLVYSWQRALEDVFQLSDNAVPIANAARIWADEFTSKKPPVDCPAMKIVLSEMDWADGITPWTEGDTSHESLHDRVVEIAKGD